MGQNTKTVKTSLGIADCVVLWIIPLVMVIIILELSSQDLLTLKNHMWTVSPDPTKVREPCAILGQPFQPRSEILNAAHGV